MRVTQLCESSRLLEGTPHGETRGMWTLSQRSHRQTKSLTKQGTQPSEAGQGERGGGTWPLALQHKVPVASPSPGDGHEEELKAPQGGPRTRRAAEA